MIRRVFDEELSFEETIKTVEDLIIFIEDLISKVPMRSGNEELSEIKFLLANIKDIMSA